MTSTPPLHDLPLVLITGGDPCGIGPEIILKALSAPLPRGVRIAVVGDVAVFQRTARRLRLRLPRWAVTSLDAFNTAGRVACVDLAHPWTFVPGRISTHAGIAQLAYLHAALALAARHRAAALVTAPVTKSAIQRVRPRFVGHTEYFAKAFGVSCPVMMFDSPQLRVVLLTRHLALRDVPRRLEPTLIRQTLLITVHALQQQFGIRHPRLAVCGPNPHAGEAGAFGTEEARLLVPLLQRLRRKGMQVDGPFAADGFFAQRLRYDAIVCCYHDQGLIPFKLLARDRGCQLTLGLPLVRTSPDHGSALDIAGKGRAHPGSMRYAIRLAATLARRSHAHQGRTA